MMNGVYGRYLQKNQNKKLLTFKSTNKRYFTAFTCKEDLIMRNHVLNMSISADNRGKAYWKYKVA